MSYLHPIELLERYRDNTLKRDRDRTLAQAEAIGTAPKGQSLRNDLLADVGALEICIVDYSSCIRFLKRRRK